MGTGIMVCGLNGSGKSTFGKALAKAIGFHFIDAEDIYFPHREGNSAYLAPRSGEEAKSLLLHMLHQHQAFVFASVKGDYGEQVSRFYRYVVLVETPKEIRMQRVRQRSFEKFGDRMLPGGDLYEQEEAFFRMADEREERYIKPWLQSVGCPVLRIDGTKPVEQNVELVISRIGM